MTTHPGKKTKLAFIGLGNMGLPIARNLLKVGHELTVYNRTRSRAEALQLVGAHLADSPAAASRESEAVMTMLSDDHALEQIVFSEDGVLDALQPGGVHISLSTISPALSRRLASAHVAKSQEYVAAPVFGRPEAAENAKLIVVAAGSRVAVEKCRHLLEPIGRALFVLEAEPPAANVVKLAGNFMIASMLETLAEAFALVRKAGIDPKQFLEITGSSLFQSPVYENYGKIIAEKRFEPAGFKMTLGFKDLRLLLAAAEELAVPLPLADLVRGHLLSAIARGRTEIDWSAIAEIVAENAGLGRERQGAG
jgi:3-hydroxyisobutyrate dehydrogenase-like beta-hydroxyacid dehydrogenase